jgi:hypothetical protein
MPEQTESGVSVRGCPLAPGVGRLWTIAHQTIQEGQYPVLLVVLVVVAEPADPDTAASRSYGFTKLKVPPKACRPSPFPVVPVLIGL